MELFKAEKVTEAITRIVMPYVCAYLIEGNDRAVLLDTGFGYGDLKSFVQFFSNFKVLFLKPFCNFSIAGLQFFYCRPTLFLV